MTTPLLSPDALRALAPELPTRALGRRYRGSGHALTLEELAPEDAAIVRESYRLLDGIYQVWRTDPRDPPWPQVAQRCRPLLDPLVRDRARALGLATREQTGGDSRIAAIIHDVRGGGLSAALGEAELLGEAGLVADPPDTSALQTLVYLARDQAKMMRNAVADLDPVQRAEDEAERPHALASVIQRWSGSRLCARGRTATIDASMDRDGQLASSCLEISAVDRVLYNHLSNAAAFAADSRIELRAEHRPGGLVRMVVANRVAPDQRAWLEDRLARDPHALYRERVTRGGEGLGMANAAFFVTQAFRLARPEEALDGGYLGGRLMGNVYAAWFHWPEYVAS